MEQEDHNTLLQPLPSDEDIRKLYEEKVKHILFTFNDQILEIEKEIEEERREAHTSS